MPCPPVLVVDDHPQMAAALAELVRSLGYGVDVVLGGRQALEYVRTRPAALVVLDLQMPDVNGWDVLRTLRADPRFDELPIVVCSAMPAALVRDKALRAGAQEFLEKDEAYEELEGAIRRHAPSPAEAPAG